MVYASINWAENPGEEVDETLLLVLNALTACGCLRSYAPFDDPSCVPFVDNPRFLLAQFHSHSALTPLTLALATLPITFFVTVCPRFEPFGCADAPRVDRVACERITD